MHIIVDGIDGSGKSTIISAIRDAEVAAGKNILDVKTFWKEHNSYPTETDINNADLIVTAEPSTIWVGRAIREELIKKGTGYSGATAVIAYALDREIHYRRIILPAKKAGKIILQDRGICTTIVYQPVQSTDVQLESLLMLPGNALALEHSPNVILIATIPSAEAMKRLADRFEKQDASIFEQQEMLERLAEGFQDASFRSLFTERGTRFVDLDTHQPIADMRAVAVAAYHTIINQ